MSEKERKIFVQKLTKTFLATISLIVLIISLWIIVDCFRVPTDTNNLILNYNTSTNLDYKVYLKPNKFYDQKFLTKDKKYISNIIDYVDIDLNYLFNTTKNVSSTYSYDVTAKISSDYELNGITAELWSKSYTLKPTISNKLDGSNFKISENLKIDYSKYDDLAKNFKEEYGVVADTKLTITININTNSVIKDSQRAISEKQNVKLVMPLNKAVTDITVSGTEPVNKNVTELIKGKRHINYVLLIMAIILSAISGPACIAIFYKLFKITNESQYIASQKKILKGYGDIIAAVTTKPDLNGLKIVEVKNFEDLINIEEELRIPILFYEFEKKDECWFVITTDQQAFRFVLTSTTNLSKNI
ncbi:MAG: DUF5305 family protein [bacterium]|nr:DUF5305 family protein [bacterium]